MALYSLSDISTFTQIDLSTLTTWERKYQLIPTQVRNETSYYTGTSLRTVLNVDYLSRRGYDLKQIAAMSQEILESTVLDRARTELEFPLQIRVLTAAMRSMNETLFLASIRSFVKEFQFEKAMTRIVYGFLNWVGVLWQTDSISIAHEHFSSQLIRQFLVSSIDKLPDSNPLNPKARHFLLFLPAGEQHELGLLLAAYLIKSRQHRVTYLGTSIPAEALRPLQQQYRTDYVLPTFVTRPINGQFRAYLKTLIEIFGQERLLLAGSPLLFERVVIPPGVQVYDSMDSLRGFLDEMS